MSQGEEYEIVELPETAEDHDESMRQLADVLQETAQELRASVKDRPAQSGDMTLPYYQDLEEWARQHGADLGQTAKGGMKDHIWGVRSAAMSLCGLWPGPDKSRPKAGQICSKCAAVARAIKENYTKLEGGTARWP